MKTTLIVDGNNLLQRAYQISKHNNATQEFYVYIFLNTLKSYVKKFEPQKIFVAWDRKLTYPSTNFRKKALKKYKQQRDRSESDDIFSVSEKIEETLSTLNIKNIYPNVLEADDVIAWLTKNLPKEDQKVIISLDQDLIQLIQNPNTIFFNPIKKFIINFNNYKNYFDIPLSQFVLYKAILGDASDNISGLKGYGPKKTQDLLSDWEQNKNQLNKEQLQEIEINKTLIDLEYGYHNTEKEIETYQNQLDQLGKETGDFSKFKKICQQQGYKSIIKNFQDWENLFFPQYENDLFDQLIAKINK